MLLLAEKMSQLDFGKLMEVYTEGNRENGEDFYPDAPPYRQILLAEEAFYQYLREVFFRTEGAFYAVWIQEGQYVSALRLEPYRDGLLLEALETAPELRRRGYAAELIRAVLATVGDKPVYSHVSKRNTASLKTHASCGFQRILEHAACIDGSVLQNQCTLRYTK